MIIFRGNEKIAYRDPACFFHEGNYHLFMTVSEKENGFMYNRLAMSSSRNLKEWSQPVMLTPKDLRLNYCSPGNVIRYDDEFVLCFTSYPMPFPYAQSDCADETARLFVMHTKDFQQFSSPEMLMVKGDMPAEALGRMIDPYLLPKDDGYWLFYKQNGVSLSYSQDLKAWQYLGHTSGGENACVIPFEGKHMLIHSPKNGIAFALSDDLKNWTEYGYTTLEQDQWPWANGRITAGFAMEAPRECGYRYLLFFHGSRNEYPETHGSASVAIAYTNDFIHFDTEL